MGLRIGSEMRILVINPALLRLTSLGACEQDRMQNIADLKRLGHAVHLLTGHPSYQRHQEVQTYYDQRGIPVTLVALSQQKLRWERLRHPGYLDGASWEYGHPAFQSAVWQALEAVDPDWVWCHGTWMWSAARCAVQYKAAIVIRSVNYEPEQLLHEKGVSLPNRIRFIGKQRAEIESLRSSNVLAAITPDELAIYQRLDPDATVRLLPLRTLPHLLRPARLPVERKPLRVFAMGATYSVPHNAAALRFLVNEVVPRARAASPGSFEFHILGSKVPADVQRTGANDLIFDGYVDDLEAHLESMDIALAPSLAGVGMQQKVFEPLCRAFPTITHRRALAGYLFTDDEHLLLADDADGYVRQLLRLRDPALRQRLSQQAAHQTANLFSQQRFDTDLRAILKAAARQV